MLRQVKSSEDELFALCDEIQAIDGKVTAARLREAAGGGGHIRLKAVVEAWRERALLSFQRSRTFLKSGTCRANKVSYPIDVFHPGRKFDSA